MQIKTAAALSVFAALSCFSADYYWNPSILTGAYFSYENWFNANLQTGSVPGSGDTANFTRNTITAPEAYTVKIQNVQGGFIDGSSTYINNLPSGTTVTFDATGTRWIKQRDEASSWNNRIFRVDNLDHIFNMEGINAGNALDTFGFTFEDGKITFLASDEGDQLIFESGTFNNVFLPDGETKGIHTTIFNWSIHRPNAKVVMKPGSVTHLRAAEIRGQTPGGEWLIEGGDHHVYDGLNINANKGEFDSDGVVHISGGKLTVESGAIWIGHNKSGAGRIKIDGTGTLEHLGNAVYFPDGKDWVGSLDISGRGSFLSSSSGIAAGHNGGKATITVSDEGRLTVSNQIHLAEGDYGLAELTIKDKGYFYANTLHAASGNNDRRAKITLQDQGALVFQNGTWGNNGTAEVTFDMTGGWLSHPTVQWINFGQNNAGIVKMHFTGGTVDDGHGNDAQGHWYFGGGPGSEYLFDGTEIHIRSMAIEGQQGIENFTNTVVMKSGRVNIRWSGAGDGLDIRGNGRNAMFLMEGGELNVGNMIRLGHAGANNGYHAVFRQTGGLVRQSGVVNICDSPGSDGEFELLGGIFKGHNIRGWTYAATRGNDAHGWAKCFFDGGTIQPYQNNANLIVTMDEARLGPKGLTVDTDGLDAQMMVKLENAEDAEGLFVKAGIGTLTANLKETDGGAKNEWLNRSLNGEFSRMIVRNGTLKLANAEEVRFGDHVTVENNAVLSLNGTPTVLTVETITLGNGKGLASLYLDQGDTVTVTGANGVFGNGGAIDGPWTGTNGTYPIFFCQNGIDAAELDRITVLNAVAGKSYTWIVEDGENDSVIASLVIADTILDITSIWNGSTSSDWNTQPNWTTTLPGATTIATFPLSSASRTVTSAPDAAAGKLLFEGAGYTLAGSDAIRIGSAIENQLGNQSVTAPLQLGRSLDLNIANGASINFLGSLRGTGTDLIKSGSGKAVVNGNNSTFAGRFITNGGTLELIGRRAFGPADLYFPITLRMGTFAYNGDEAYVNATLQLEAPAAKTPVIVNNTGDLTFTAVSHTKGLLVKRGAGTLRFDLPEGTFTLGSAANDDNAGESNERVVLPDNGDSPITLNGIYGVTILEGTLSFTGQGIDKTIASTLNTALAGGSLTGTTAPAILEVKNMRLNFGNGGRHACFARHVPVDAQPPEIRLEDAYFWTDSMRIGDSADQVIRPKVTMRNSTFFDHYNAGIASATVHPIIEADNSKLYNDGMIGMTILGSLDAVFTGPDALFGTVNIDTVNNNNAGILAIAESDIAGTILFKEGATLAITRELNAKNRSDNSDLQWVFDGGIFEIRNHNLTNDCVSTLAATARQGFTTEGKGLTVKVLEGVRHSITFPIRGTADVVKAGAGTLAMTNSYSYGEGEVPSRPILMNTGMTRVSEGTLLLNGGLALNSTRIAVDADATLDLVASFAEVESVSGAGTVANGVLCAKLLVDPAAETVLTLSHVELSPDGNQKVFFDFGEGGPDAFFNKTVTILRLTDGSATAPNGTVDVSTWKGESAARGILYTFSHDADTGDVKVTFAKMLSGTTILFR